MLGKGTRLTVSEIPDLLCNFALQLGREHDLQRSGAFCRVCCEISTDRHEIGSDIIVSDFRVLTSGPFYRQAHCVCA